MPKNDEMQSGPRAPVTGAAGPGGRPGAPGPKKSSTGLLIFGLIVCVVAGVVIVRLVQNHKAAAAAQASGAGGGGGGRGGGRGGALVVPVVAGTVAKKDVPIYLDGLGTVQAFNTVTIRARVDGQLKRVAFTEGQDVRTGDLLAEIDAEPYRTQVEQNKAKKAEDQAQLENAQVDLKRNEDLLKQNIVAPQVYDTAKALVNQLAATVLADQAAIDNAQVQLDYCRVLSPIDGRTGIRQVDQGNIIHAGDSNGLVVITQLKPISVVGSYPEQSLGEIRKELSQGEVKVLAVDRDDHTVLGEGKVAVIDNQIDTTTGTLKLKANFPNETLRLWPGQFVNARLLLTTRKGGIVVPAPVIQRGPDGPYAFVIKADMSVEIRKVKVNQIAEGVALIDDGLKPGEKVVVEGQYRLQAGTKVKPAQSAKPADDDEP